MVNCFQAQVIIVLLAVSVTLVSCVPPLKNIPKSKAKSAVPTHVCCMPRQHTFHYQGSKTELTNCKGDHYAKSNFGIFRERHTPDFYKRRYRFESFEKINNVIIDNTVLGFMDPYPSKFGIEYSFNKTSCSCKKLTQLGEMLMVTCVDSDYDFDGYIDVGIQTEKHVQAQRFIRKKVLSANVTQTDFMIVQPIEEKFAPLPYPDPYPCLYDCAIIEMDTKTEVTGPLDSVSSIFGTSWNFKPYNTDTDFEIPSHCPKC